MKLTKVIINNFRSFGESQIIELNNQTVLIGNNSSGKTTVLQALSKLFSDKQNDRIIKKSDFHLPKGSRPGENTRNLFIETIFEFDELGVEEGAHFRLSEDSLLHLLTGDAPRGIEIHEEWLALALSFCLCFGEGTLEETDASSLLCGADRKR